MELLTTENIIILFSVLTGIGVLFTAIAKQTKTKEDDKLAAKFMSVLNTIKNVIIPKK